MKITASVAQKIIDRYVSGEGSAELASEFHVAKDTIIRVLSGRRCSLSCVRPHDIQQIMLARRNFSGARTDLPSEFTERQNQILVGSLLGDGSLPGSGNNRRFEKKQGRQENRKEYLDWHFQEMLPYSSMVSRQYATNKIKMINGKITHIRCEKYHAGYLFSTFSHKLFLEFYRRWYPDGKKIVPKNLVLDSLSIAIWFCDDGENNSQRHNATFHTNGFNVEDVAFLQYKLLDFNINASIARKDNKYHILRMFGSSYDSLMELVKPHVNWNCFKYKIQQEKIWKR